jgi:hypothetical protein
MARRLLFKETNWQEYDHGLTLYLLGALKFKNLDNTAKQVAFWGAATAQKLALDPPLCRQPWLIHTCRGRVTLVILLAALLIFLLGLAVLQPFNLFPQRARGEPIAVVTGLEPVVEVRPDGSNRVHTAVPLMSLHQGDMVITSGEGTAFVVCTNGLLFVLPPQNILTVTCQDSDDSRIITRLSPDLVRVSSTITVTLAGEETRGPRDEVALTPLLLTPRNTFTREARPLFRWQAVAGATGYRLSVNTSDGHLWQWETAETDFTYPADIPPLQPGSANVVTLATLDDPTREDKSVLRVLAESDSAELTDAEAEIHALAVDNNTIAYLLAQLYQKYHLWDAAIAQLETLTAVPEIASATIWLQLGNLYFDTALYVQASESYQQALTAAQAEANVNTQANAYLGLARTAYAFQEIEQTVDYLHAAEQLYRRAGNIAQAELVAIERAKIEAPVNPP